jgi:hypothetical protein
MHIHIYIIHSCIHDPITRGGGGAHGVVGFDEGVVDGDDIDFIILDGISEDDTTDTAETVDAKLCWSHNCYGGGVSWRPQYVLLLR